MRIVIGQAPGSATDVISRVVGNQLSEALGQPIVIDARPGAGGVLGTEVAARSAPDGYTLFMENNSTHGSNPAVYAKLPYDAVKDFAPMRVGATPRFTLPAAGPTRSCNGRSSSGPGSYAARTTPGCFRGPARRWRGS